MGSLSTATSDLTGLYSIFEEPMDRVPQARFASKEELPSPQAELFAHEHHMTVTLENYHEAPVRVLVLKSIREEMWYARKIVLLHTGNARIVLFTHDEALLAETKLRVVHKTGMKDKGELLTSRSLTEPVLQEFFAVVGRQGVKEKSRAVVGQFQQQFYYDYEASRWLGSYTSTNLDNGLLGCGGRRASRDARFFDWRQLRRVRSAQGWRGDSGAFTNPRGE